MRRSDITAIYRRFLKDEGLIELVPASLNALKTAAACRGTLSGSLADATHVATASLSDCSAFVTTDHGVRLAPPREIIQFT